MTLPKYTPLYSTKEISAIEKKWFDMGNESIRLMQQAAWQIAIWLQTNASSVERLSLQQVTHQNLHEDHSKIRQNWQNTVASNYLTQLNICVWVGAGNNGGDGWYISAYLQQLGARVCVIEVGAANTKDAKAAKAYAKQQDVKILDFLDVANKFGTGQKAETKEALEHGLRLIKQADVFIDALFGIGLDRAPNGIYADAIHLINRYGHDAPQQTGAFVMAVDVPSGLVSDTGQVFDSCAVKADITLCLVARKLGLHTKDGIDYRGQVVDIPLIPSVLIKKPVAYLQQGAIPLPARHNNSQKGNFGNILIIGGNQVDGSQGMGGAAISAASSAFACGAGKVTVACHKAFHSSVITRLPDAMVIDLQDSAGVIDLIASCDAIAIGMGLGRDDTAKKLFYNYIDAIIEAGVDMLIDADGLYHIAHQDKARTDRLAAYGKAHRVWYTPHSGEAARLLGIKVDEVEADRLSAIQTLIDTYHGTWLIKGTGSIVIENNITYVCGSGNGGMATAGMGDVLSGLGVGLMAQSALPPSIRSLQQAVMIHATAGDKLAQEKGQWALQSVDMPKAIGEVMRLLTVSKTQ